MRSSSGVIAALTSLFAYAVSHPLTSPPSPIPLLIWHGLGDRYDADGIQSVADLAKEVHPGTYVYAIRTDDDGATDSRNTFFGNISAQLDVVCDTLTNDPLLNSSHTRVDALGFSQGGQFLRGLVERCPGVNVRNLVTFGSQHNGIAQFQTCGTWDLVCKGAIAAVKGNAWSDFVQRSIVPAQYYREINNETGLGAEAYLNASHFLADINNEREQNNDVYKARIAALDKFVMVVFDEDTTVLPKESGWFAEVNATKGVTHLRERKMYKEDWLGLRALDDKDGLVFKSTPGKHMELKEKMLAQTFQDYFGPESKQNLLQLASGLIDQSILSS